MKYIFAGLNRHEYAFRFPRKKTKSVFLPGNYRPIMGGSPSRYYVKSGGDDSADGLSDANAWKTLGKIGNADLLGGDEVLLNRGNIWSGEQLVAGQNGLQGSPITLGAYGNGPDPELNYAAFYPIHIDGDWYIVEDLQCSASGGPMLYIAGDNVIAQRLEATNCGFGVEIEGADALVTRCNIHDLNMIVSDGAPDNDYGAVGVIVYGSGQRAEISWNTFANCQDDSIDYTFDGGATEVYLSLGQILSDLYVHHNKAKGCNGFIEIAGDGTGTCKDAKIAYNLSSENWWFGQFLTSGDLYADIDNCRVENNTIYQFANMYDSPRTEEMLLLSEDVSPSVLKLKNNIFCVDGDNGGQWNISKFTGFEHIHNLYHLLGGAQLGFVPDITEILGDPDFINPGTDFHLKSSSPARENGTPIADYLVDLDGVPLPPSVNPDIGAYQYKENIMSVVTDLEAIESDLRVQAVALTASADAVLAAINDLKAVDDVLDAAADVIEAD